MRNTVITGVCVALSLGAVQAHAQIAVSSNDHKITQENGVNKNVANPPPDTITIMDLGALPVKVVGTVSNVPGSELSYSASKLPGRASKLPGQPANSRSLPANFTSQQRPKRSTLRPLASHLASGCSSSGTDAGCRSSAPARGA